MKKKITREIVEDFNTIIKYLSKRDIEEIASIELIKNYDVEKVDLIIVLGSAIPYIAEEGARVFKKKLAKEIMIVGGIGHSTKYLVENIVKSSKYIDIDTDNRAEADILRDILIKYEDIKEEDIIIENKSTNCGSNAHEALKVIKKNKRVPKTALLLQDPTMQFRTNECFKKEWEKEDTVFINYSPFIPLIKEENNSFTFIDDRVYGLWDIDRFISLVMGEIPRLKDDESGYGPKGKGFIGHVDIPKDVLESYERLLSFYGEYIEIRNKG